MHKPKLIKDKFIPKNILQSRKIRLSVIILILLFSLTIRLSVVFWGYHGDLNNNISWGKSAYEKGLNNFYTLSDSSRWEYSAPNQPPLTILMFFMLRYLWTHTGIIINYLNDNIPIFPSGLVWFWEDKGMILFVKLPSIIADLLIGIILYRLTFITTKNIKKSLAVFLIWLLNPIVWYNSSVWGQTDSIVNLLGLLAVVYLLRKNISGFVSFFTLSVLFKGSLLIFGPLCIYILIKQAHSFKKWITAFFIALILTISVSIWFYPRVDLPVWIIDLYRKRIMPGEIDYVSANAFNLWNIIGSETIRDNITIYTISARTIGFILFGIVYIMVIKHLFSNKKNGQKETISSLSLIALAAFLLLTRVHERYLYPFFPYATFMLAFRPYIVIPYILLSLIHLLNLYNLFWVPPIPSIESILKISDFRKILSLLCLLTLFYLLTMTFRQKSQR